MDTTRRLDEFERDLPPIAAGVVRLNRAVLRSVGRAATFGARAVRDALDSIMSTTSTATSTVGGQAKDAAETFSTATGTELRVVAGQARRAAKDVVSTADTQTRTVAGQARAQSRRVGERIADETEELIERATDAVEDVADDRPGSGVPYEQWTRAQLYERAQALDIEGRSGMSKAQLVRALRAS